MKIFHSRQVEPIPRPSRNFLYLLETSVIERYRSMVVRELKEYLSADELECIKLTPLDELCEYHHSLGAAIRNEYELWLPCHEVTAVWHMAEIAFPLCNETPNTPTEVRIGDKIVRVFSSEAHIEDHPCHPDNFSMSCVRQLWEDLQ
jgi:hypothetical protein